MILDRPADEPPRSTAQRVVGAVLVLPALLALAGTYLEPTIWTVRSSFRGLNVLTGAAEQAGGLESYRRVLADGYGRQVAFALSLAAVPLLIALVAAPLLAYAMERAGRVSQTAARVVLAVPLALYAPVGVAAAWRAADAGLARGAAGVRSIFWLATAGLVWALATTAYAAALRAGPAGRRRAVVVTGAVVALATVAAALQAFTYPLVIAVGGRGPNPAETPLTNQFNVAFVQLRTSVAAASNTLTLALLGVLGVLAAALLIAARMRLTVDPRQPAPRQPARTAATIAGLVLLLGVLVAAHLPWFARLSDLGDDPGAALANTWLPPLVSITVAVGLAGLAAFGIGALRPLGRRSELLLLLFAPWLFVGVGPFAPRAWVLRRDLGLYGEWLSLVPPTWLAIPALFVLTLLFSGLATRPGATVGSTIPPALPLAGLAFVATWVVHAHDLLWPHGVWSPVTGSPPAAVAVWRGLVGPGDPPIGLTGPLPLLLLLLALAVAAQLFYLSRVSLLVGRRETIGS